MPLPIPRKREKENDFIGRCVPLVLVLEGLDKDDDKERKQAVAICYTQWRKAKGGKTMEIEDLAGLVFDVDGEEVTFEDLIEAYKAREDVKGDGAREKAKAAQKARSKKYGIAVREDGNVTKPSEWEDVPDGQFADPVNYSYPCPNVEQTQAALRYWGKAKNKAKYSSEDQGTITARLKKFAKKFKVGELVDKSLELDDASLDEFSRQVRDAWYAQYKQPTAMTQPAGGDWWVKDVFEDHIIVDAAGGLYKYPYSVADDGGVTFGEAVKVELVYKPVPEGKSANYCIKRLGETDTGWYIGGYGMIWGSGQQRDLSPWPNADGSKGEFFTPQTQGLDDLPVKVITFEHDKEAGPDGSPFRHVLGTTVLERDDAIGRWIEALIEKRRKYANYVVDLIDQQALNFSSETASHWREVAEDGEIKMWRTAGYTTTTHPMEPRLTDVNRLKAYYKSLDLDLAEPDTGGAPEDGGLEMEKAKAKARVLLSRIRKGEVKEL